MKEAIKIEFSQRGLQYTSLGEPDIQVLGARVSTKGSNIENAINPAGEEDGTHVIPSMGLYVQGHNCTHLVALGKIYNGGSTIHSGAYADDVVWVSVEKIYDGDAQVPFLMSEIQYVRQILYTFIAWPTHLVKLVLHEVIVSLFSSFLFFILHVQNSFMDKWSSSLGHGSIYGFLEPQSIHNAKDRHPKCQNYIETWIKESQREIYLGAYLN